MVDLIRRLRGIAEMGIVNARNDTAAIREAADRLEGMEERLAIIGEPGAVLISRALNAKERDQLWEAFRLGKPIYISIERLGDDFTVEGIGPLPAALDGEDKVFSGLIEEE